LISNPLRSRSTACPTAYLAVTNLLDNMKDTHAIAMAQFALEAMQVRTESRPSG
jgi:hypothetical protein